MEVLALKMKNNIKELRKARGLRQEDMAKLLGVSRQTIVAMENDKYDPCGYTFANGSENAIFTFIFHSPLLYEKRTSRRKSF